MFIKHHPHKKEKAITALVYKRVPAPRGSKCNSFYKGRLGFLLSTTHNRPIKDLAPPLTHTARGWISTFWMPGKRACFEIQWWQCLPLSYPTYHMLQHKDTSGWTMKTQGFPQPEVMVQLYSREQYSKLFQVYLVELFHCILPTRLNKNLAVSPTASVVPQLASTLQYLG